jgi:hypothetical protein
MDRGIIASGADSEDGTLPDSSVGMEEGGEGCETKVRSFSPITSDGYETAERKIRLEPFLFVADVKVRQG